VTGVGVEVRFLADSGDDIPPSAANLLTVARPMPVAVPVMTIVFGICDS
jgi:hypothetical protein